jgi:hypothetical protein
MSQALYSAKLLGEQAGGPMSLTLKDMPYHASHAHNLSDLQPCQAFAAHAPSSLFKHCTASSTTRRRYLRRISVALSLPAALLASIWLPAARDSTTPMVTSDVVLIGAVRTDHRVELFLESADPDYIPRAPLVDLVDPQLIHLVLDAVHQVAELHRIQSLIMQLPSTSKAAAQQLLAWSFGLSPIERVSTTVVLINLTLEPDNTRTENRPTKCRP